MPPLFLIPIADENDEKQITPAVNYALIALNFLVFIFLQSMNGASDFTMAFSTVPAEIVTNRDVVTDDHYVDNPYTGQEVLVPGLRTTPIPVRWTLLTSMFMHASWLHLLGNMLFLWIFGDNIEDDLGHGRYLVFYLLTGFIASLAHVLMNQSGASAVMPSLGASGAIAGVLGAYVVRHPDRKVQMLFMFYFIITVPAVVAIGVWFAMQILGGLGNLSSRADGVAYSAHIGGFTSGALLIWLFLPRRKREQPAKPTRVLDEDDFV